MHNGLRIRPEGTSSVRFKSISAGQPTIRLIMLISKMIIDTRSGDAFGAAPASDFASLE